MFLLNSAPIQSLIFFSIAPILGALVGLAKAVLLKAQGNAREGEARVQIFKGIRFGLLIDLPLLIAVLVLFSST